MSCNFDCSAPTPLSPNSDITGIGIIINNIVTTGIAVVIISIYHFTAYDPIHDLSHDGQTPFRPNPVDVSSLALFKSYLSPFVKIARSKRFANVLIKCIRAMSDMQIMTGFFLLISGYSQLKCGLATYHWLVVVDQAWLSCLVQLSCLTHLRSYFHNRPIERTLRLLAAGVSTIMLIVGLSFTGNYDWAFHADSSDPDHPTISDPAICYMRARPAMNSAFFSMPFSIILIIFGFASRVIILYDTLSVSVVRARTSLAGHIRGLLRIVYNWSRASRSPRSLKLTLGYLPLLAIYLTGSVFVDVWDSAAIEVVWLIIAFAFGITRVIGIIHRPEKMGLDASLTSFNDWSFGQVGAMVVLAAPLITLIGLFYEEDETRVQDEEPLSDSQTAPPPELPAPSISNVTTDLNDPFKDWISHSQIFYLVDGHIFTMIISVFFWMAERDPFGKIKKTLLEDILVSSGIKMVVPILFSLMVETIFAEAGPTSISYNLAQVVVKLHSLSCLTFFSVSSSTKITYCLLPILVIWALAHRFYPFFQALFSSKLLAFLRLS
ncbi:hypothetical protein DTO006G1_9667 [Penicillium roqueforti]|uniref:uncharacterized protein n=1 Tax=Penicillium roqueforti TaxID=5082 RepID=UPI00190B9E96|nr:uncharacterized protein LCP9604111_7021 [Penicillium roqueforti]KAF9245163.1 hypothetical protein LCP9604111_7021 [Penicillium roqueforti]KAI1833232.1 hypothetical protein CBS147337_5730 [Penicillium roqueforti]KAI2671171.1 hypothetical protein CBS147355_8765 [Penicillium roqueforti]KAI2695732.1 hypothetical protein CBS147372_8995 [Penicillium roqueforti]KAI2709940.1 hypothetical protein CBS147318_8799 [Penicillium roqueforti]